LGVAARHTLTSLERASVPNSVVDVDPGYGRHRHEQIALPSGPHETGQPIRVYVLTVGEALLWWLRNPVRALTSALNVVVVFWELDTLTDDMFAKSDTSWAPWYVVPSNDKKRARLAIISHILEKVPYKKVKAEKIKLPKRGKAQGYKEPDYPYKYILSPA